MRTVLAIFFIAAGTATGLYRAYELKKRENLLTEIIHLLENMATQIRYRALPLGELFDALGGDDAARRASGRFIAAVREHARDGLNRREAWNRAACDFTELDPRDREILLSVGNSLGQSDAQGQVSMLEMSGKLLLSRQQEAAEVAAKKGSMYRSVGLLAGLAMAIIVI